MQWLSQNWVWILFAVGMIAMHMFGHGGHGGHGGERDGDQRGPKPANKDGEQRTSQQGSGHQH